MKWTSIGLAALLAVPFTTFGQSPAQGPTTQPRQQMFPNRMGDGMPNRMGRGGPMVSQQDIDAAVEFARVNFPAHFELYSTSPAPRQAAMWLVRRYQPLLKNRDNNSPMYQAMLSQAKFEDDVLSFAYAQREGKPGADANLQEAARKMVDSGLEQRRQRIENLRRSLDQQQRQLDEDLQKRDQWIATKIQQAGNQVDNLMYGPGRNGPGDQKPPETINALPQSK